jgi:hypothetical protein
MGTQALKAVEFGSVKVGGWFKESAQGTWLLKTSASKGMYQSSGTRYEPRFASNETVYTDTNAGVEYEVSVG